MSALEGLKNSIRRWGGSDDDESYSNELESAKEEPVQEAPSRSSSQASNANKIYTYNASTTLHLVVNRPKKLSDTAEIAELYKNKTTVILMLNNTNKDIATRIIDFLGGVSYITGGEIKRIADTTYVLAPYNVDISGEFIDEISNISGEDIFRRSGLIWQTVNLSKIYKMRRGTALTDPARILPVFCPKASLHR